MYDDWRDRIVACVHEDSRDERKARFYRAMIRDWAEEAVRNAPPAFVPTHEKLRREHPNWTEEEIARELHKLDEDLPDGTKLRGENALDVLADPIAITTHSGTPLIKQYATLAAIHDASKHCDFPIDPWAGGHGRPYGERSEDERHEFHLGIKYELLKHAVSNLTDADKPGIERMLEDVAVDLARRIQTRQDGEQTVYPDWLVAVGRCLEEAAVRNPTVREHFSRVCRTAIEAHCKGVRLLPLPPPTLPEKYVLLCAIHDVTCQEYDPFNPWWAEWRARPVDDSPGRFRLVHGVLCTTGEDRGTEIDPLARSMGYFEGVGCAAVSELKDDDRQAVEVALADVLADLASKGLVGAQAGGESTASSESGGAGTAVKQTGHKKRDMPTALTGDETTATVNRMLQNDPEWSWKRTKPWLTKKGVTVHTRASWRDTYGAPPPQIKGNVALVNESELNKAVRDELQLRNKAFDVIDVVAGLGSASQRQ